METGMEETIFVVVEREEETEETDKSPSVELRPTARLGTRVSVMENFVSKTKQFYKSFLDGLYAVADLMLEPRPDPKPPDIDIPDDETPSSVQPSTVGGGELHFLIRFES